MASTIPKLPPPPFPTRFTDRDDHELDEGTLRQAAPWPAGQDEQAHADSDATKWKLKTPQEAYIDVLEQKLKEARSAQSPEPVENEEQDDPRREPSAEEEESQVRMVLLAGQSSSMNGEGERPFRAQLVTDGSVVVVPPTPSRPSSREPLAADVSLDDEEEAMLRDMENSRRRISFSSSVRIASGRPRAVKPSNPGLPPTWERPGDPQQQVQDPPSRPPSALQHHISRSRSRSPALSHSGHHSLQHSRTPSMSSINGGQLPPSLVGSFSASGGFPSGASSPCSSIYAPLQPPSKICPTPFNRTIPPPANRTNSASFRNYLLGGVGDEVDSEEELRSGYKTLLQEQMKKKMRQKMRRKMYSKRHLSRTLGEAENGGRRGSAGDSRSLWQIFKDSLATGAGARRAGLMGVAGVTPPPAYRYGSISPSPSYHRRNSSRGSSLFSWFSSTESATGAIDTDSTSDSGQEEEEVEALGARKKRARRQSRRMSSHSYSDADDEREEAPLGALEGNSSTSTGSSAWTEWFRFIFCCTGCAGRSTTDEEALY